MKKIFLWPWRASLSWIFFSRYLYPCMDYPTQKSILRHRTSNLWSILNVRCKLISRKWRKPTLIQKWVFRNVSEVRLFNYYTSFFGSHIDKSENMRIAWTPGLSKFNSVGMLQNRSRACKDCWSTWEYRRILLFRSPLAQHRRTALWARESKSVLAIWIGSQSARYSWLGAPSYSSFQRKPTEYS